jgi:serine/threonine protein kinase
MNERDLDDLLDQLVAEYSDRVAKGERGADAALLARAPAEHRETLERCFRMIQAGLASAPSASARLGPGVKLDQFEIVRELGRGGMSIVYLAKQVDLRRPVALKVLRPGLALERRHVDRFRREALAIARLQHPHIVQVHAVGEALGWHYLAMEYVEGRSLADAYAELAKLERPTGDDLARITGFRSEHASLERALCALLAPVVRALGVAHDLGLVHRDVKPSNILIHKDGRAVLADFGLAKGDGDPGLSLTGEPLGTPYYMSPEQATLIAEPIDRRTDVYSLGVTLFEGLTGKRPYEGESMLQVLERLRTTPAPSVRTLVPALSSGIDAVVRRAMAKLPSERYPTALELAVDLASVADGQTPQALVREGTGVRRVWRVWRGLVHGEIPEYRSTATLFGLPLVHVVMHGQHFARPRRWQFPDASARPPIAVVASHRGPVAKGWFACGPSALGFVAIGGLARGVFAFGGLALGLFGIGGFALGGLVFGGVSMGLFAFGGAAAGQTALGGMAVGQYALGGRVHAVHAIDATRRDEEALEWFRDLSPLVRALPGGEHLSQLIGDAKEP